jgi:hypothetical protein
MLIILEDGRLILVTVTPAGSLRYNSTAMNGELFTIDGQGDGRGGGVLKTESL